MLPPAFTAPAREGYVFDGWNPAVAANVTEAATYTAVWKNDGASNEGEAAPSVPVTGDSTPILLMSLLLVVSAAVAAVVISGKRKADRA